MARARALLAVAGGWGHAAAASLAGRRSGDTVARRAAGWVVLGMGGTVLVVVGASGLPEWSPFGDALAAGSVTAIASAVAIAAAFGVPRGVLVSLAPKSVTAGVAMAISEGLGGEPALTAVLVIATGLVGAVMVTPLMNALGIRDYAARGFAVGLASHGIGTARAFSVDPVAGTLATDMDRHAGRITVASASAPKGRM